jgi:hypothetical protein
LGDAQALVLSNLLGCELIPRGSVPLLHPRGLMGVQVGGAPRKAYTFPEEGCKAMRSHRKWHYTVCRETLPGAKVLVVF